MPAQAKFEALGFDKLTEQDQLQQSAEFLQRMLKRRSVRHFSCGRRYHSS